MRELPEHMRNEFRNVEHFMTVKRAQAMVACEVMDRLLTYCFYTPAETEIIAASHHLEEACKKLAAKWPNEAKGDGA